MTKDELVRALAEVVSGLQVPISLGMNLGKADAPWRDIKNKLAPGWVDSDLLEQKFQQVLTSGTDHVTTQLEPDRFRRLLEVLRAAGAHPSGLGSYEAANDANALAEDLEAQQQRMR